MSDQEPRSFEDLAQHADIVREDAQNHSSRFLSTPGWKADRQNLAEVLGLIERLSAQVSELAERLSQQQEANAGTGYHVRFLPDYDNDDAEWAVVGPDGGVVERYYTEAEAAKDLLSWHREA